MFDAAGEFKPILARRMNSHQQQHEVGLRRLVPARAGGLCTLVAAVSTARTRVPGNSPTVSMFAVALQAAGIGVTLWEVVHDFAALTARRGTQ